MAERNFPHSTTNQNNYPDLPSVWNFCAYLSDIISWETSGGIAKCQLFPQSKGAGKRAIPPPIGLLFLHSLAFLVIKSKIAGAKNVPAMKAKILPAHGHVCEIDKL